ncbi:AMP-binding protein [Catenovulum agarivorans]|uniref:AMP-binding protein n=1 Tax=Catenovulum agarivorans TaxID=1172192 RepID=UPI0002E62156|nr:AMP-binding protein [Catenovulum agarivorans]
MKQKLILNPQQFKFAAAGESSQLWMQYYQASRKLIQASPADTWLLFNKDSFKFSACIFALITEHKRIVLPPSNQASKVSEIVELTGATTFNSAQLQLEQNSSQISDIELPLDAQIDFFTSGSTGSAKCIHKSFNQLVTEVKTLEQTFSHSPQQICVVSTVSHQHIYGMLFKLLWPLVCGHKLLSQTYEYPEHMVNAVADIQQKLVLITSPAHIHRLVADNVLSAVADKFLQIFSSGGPLDMQKNLAFSEPMSCRVTEVFGSTETGGIAWRQYDGSEHSALWQPFAGVEVCANQAEQRLVVNSPYIVQPHYLTDDRIELVDGQKFKLLGRVDRVVKIEEKRVSLDDLQQKLAASSYFNDVYVLPIQSKNRQQLAAVMVLTEQGCKELTELGKFKFDQQLRRYLQQWFEPVVTPKKFRYIDALPYNAQGKLNKQQMESYFD